MTSFGNFEEKCSSTTLEETRYVSSCWWFDLVVDLVVNNPPMSTFDTGGSFQRGHWEKEVSWSHSFQASDHCWYIDPSSSWSTSFAFIRERFWKGDCFRCCCCNPRVEVSCACSNTCLPPCWITCWINGKQSASCCAHKPHPMPHAMIISTSTTTMP